MYSLWNRLFSEKKKTFEDVAIKYSRSSGVHETIRERKGLFVLQYLTYQRIQFQRQGRLSEWVKFLNESENSRHNTLLYISCMHSEYLVTGFLLEHGVELNTLSFCFAGVWQLPLTYAISYDNKLLTRLLIVSGASLDEPDPSQDELTPRQLAELPEHQIIQPIIKEAEVFYQELNQLNHEIGRFHREKGSEIARAACHSRMGDIYVACNQNTLGKTPIYVSYTLSPYYLKKALTAYQQALDALPPSEKEQRFELLTKMAEAQAGIGEAYYQLAEAKKRVEQDREDWEWFLPEYAKLTLAAYEQALKHYLEMEGNVFGEKGETTERAIHALLEKIVSQCEILGEDALLPYRKQLESSEPISPAQAGLFGELGTPRHSPVSKDRSGSNGSTDLSSEEGKKGCRTK